LPSTSALRLLAGSPSSDIIHPAPSCGLSLTNQRHLLTTAFQVALLHHHTAEHSEAQAMAVEAVALTALETPLTPSSAHASHQRAILLLLRPLQPHLHCHCPFLSPLLPLQQQ